MKRFLPYYRYLLEVKWFFLLAVLAGAIGGTAAGAGYPWVLKVVLPGIFDQADRPLMELVKVASLLPLVFFVQGIFTFLNQYLISYCGFRVIEGIQVQVFGYLQKLPLSFFNKNKSGDLLSRLMNDTQMMRAAIVNVSNDIIIQPCRLIAALVYIVILALDNKDSAYLLACLATIPLCVFPIRKIGKKLLRKAKDVQKKLGSLTAYVSDDIQAPMEIRAFNMQKSVVAKFATRIAGLLSARMKVVKYDKLLIPIIDVVSAAGIAVTIVYAGRVGMDLDEEVLPLIAALYMSYDPLKRLGKLHTTVQQATASLDRVEYILHYPDELPEAENPVQLQSPRGDVAFEQVSFSYDEDTVLDGISVAVPAGQVVAMVGPSGAGKSTFAQLVPRFYDVSDGRVTIDGKDVRVVSKHDLREAVSIVSQTPVLFNESVMENIRMGKPSASDAEVVQAAKKAHAHGFIRDLDGGQGYNTMVGERGTRLSGGQRQRIAIARAFIKDAPVLILDEATSALDSESEAKVQDALEELVKGRTTFIIAHRFSTIKICDRILVFDRGKIVADGPHEAIYRSNPLYRELYDRQSG